MSGSLRRFWPVLAVFALLGAAGAFAGPHLWAWRHLSAAQDALKHYHADEARPHLDSCLAVWPDSVEVRLLASRAARLAGDYDAAEEQLRQCHRLQNPPTREITLEWAMLHASAGDLDEVEGDLQDYIRKNPDQAGPAREALAEGYLRMYRVMDALSCLQQWLAVQPNEAQAYNLRGNLYWQINALAKAADEYRRVVELDPGRREARERLAIGLIESGRYDDALKQLEMVRQWKPDDPDVEARIARCQEWLDRPKEAQETLDRVLAQYPDHGPALRLRGQILLQGGHPTEAEPWLSRAVEAMPEDYASNWALYDCLEKQGKSTAAKAQLARSEDIKDRSARMSEITTRGMSARPRDPALRCELGLLFLKRGSRPMGESWLISALSLDPHYAPAHAALADYYQEQGDEQKAALHRKQAQAAPSPTSPSKEP
jgi:tetratricopeptide (TPR) repeat protein